MSKKKTHEEYVEELKNKNPDIEVVDEYINTKTKIKHHCLIHDVYWDISPCNALKGQGCYECSKEKNRKKLSKTHKEYVEELKTKNHNVEVIGKYINAKTKIEHHCLIHNVYWKIEPSNVLSGQGCPKCHSDKIGKIKRKTHEQYVEELHSINPNIQVLEKYIDAKTPIRHKCLIDNYEWKVCPSSTITQKSGCPKCAGNIRKTCEQYVQELSALNPYVEPLEEYVSANISILHRCKIHDIEWKISPSRALSGSGCPQCKVERSGAGKNKKTHKQYVKELKNVNPYIQTLEEYIDMKTPILHRCLKDNFVWKTSPASTLYGSQCPECSRKEKSDKRKKSHDQYVKDVKKINRNIQVLGNYTDAKTPILHKCLIDNFEWNPIPSNILKGSGCPICAINKNVEIRRKPQEQYIKEVQQVNPDIEVIGVYVSLFEPIKHRCKLHNFIYNTAPNNVLHRAGGCPLCSESKGERKIRQWLEKNHIDYIYQHKYEDCRDIKPLPFDFYLPTFNYLIEHDGKQHFEPIEYFGGEEYFKIVQKHDKIKNEYCNKNGIPLLRIPYFKFNNIEEELNNFLFI